MVLFTNSNYWNLLSGANDVHTLNLNLFLYVFFLKEVQPNSPADIAGLRSNTDYIIGADSVLHEVRVLFLKMKGCME